MDLKVENKNEEKVKQVKKISKKEDLKNKEAKKTPKKIVKSFISKVKSITSKKP